MLSRLFILSMELAAIVAAAWATGVAEAGGGCRGMPVTDAEATTVDMEGACFSPTIARVEAGATVTFFNRSGMAHTVTGANASWGDYTEIADGQSVALRFTEAGTYPYFCLLHPGMIGAVVVGDGGGSNGDAVEPAAAGRPSELRDRASSDGDGGAPTTAIAIGVLAGLAVAAGAGGCALGRLRAG